MTGDPMLRDEDNAVLEAIRKRLAEERDPLDEDDHRPRHVGGWHLYRWGACHWHTAHPDRMPDWCDSEHDDDTLASWLEHVGPLTFCDCPC